MKTDLKIHWAVIASMIVLGVAPVAGASSPGYARGMATADIKDSSLERVVGAVEEVFTGEGFDIVDRNDTGFVFERPASRWKDLSYGGIEGGIVEQAVVEIEEKNPALHWVNCDVFMIRGREKDSLYPLEETKVMRAFGREYRKLLAKVKKLAEERPSDADKK